MVGGHVRAISEAGVSDQACDASPLCCRPLRNRTLREAASRRHRVFQRRLRAARSVRTVRSGGVSGQRGASGHSDGGRPRCPNAEETEGKAVDRPLLSIAPGCTPQRLHQGAASAILQRLRCSRERRSARPYGLQMSTRSKKSPQKVVPIRPQAAPRLEALVDGEPVVIEGAERIELRCGKASITLTKEGKILIKGTLISSESSGAHRIRGGSVDIN